MGIGVSVFLLAVGAILAFAVEKSVSGLDIAVIGYILMVCGLIGLGLAIYAMDRTRRATVVRDETIVRDRGLPRDRDVY